MTTEAITDLPVGVIDPDTLTEKIDEPEVGQIVAVYTRGRVRAARVTKVGPKRVTVEYTTPGAVDEAWKIAAIDRLARLHGEIGSHNRTAERYERRADLMERLGIVGNGDFVALADLPDEYVRAAVDAQDRRNGRTYLSAVADLRKWAADLREDVERLKASQPDAIAWNARPLADKAREHVHMTTFVAKRENVWRLPA